MTGRPKSNAIRQLEGIPKTEKRVSMSTGSGFPECPRKLFVGKDGKPDKVAQDCWRRLKREFDIESDMISGLDFHALFLFCEAWSRFCLASQEVKQNGFAVSGANGGLVKNPALQALTSAEKTMIKIACELGLTPASRQKLLMDHLGDGKDDFPELPL